MTHTPKRVRVTLAQLRYLRNVQDPDPNFRNTSAGYYCRRDNLTEWLWEMTDGTFLTQSEVGRLPKPLPKERCLKYIAGEVLTDKGAAALANEG